MKNGVTTLLPIKPCSPIKLGAFVTPLLVETIGRLTNTPSVLIVNHLNSYKDYKISTPRFLQDLQDNDIHFTNITSDSELLANYQPIIEKLINNNHIQQQTCSVARCECGKVDILKDSFSQVPDPKLISTANDEWQCVSCHSPLIVYDESVLTLKLPSTLSADLNIIPHTLLTAFNGLKDNFQGSSILISKLRNTGMSINFNNTKYNIDVDFLLFLTPQLFDQPNVNLVTCRKHLYQMFMTNAINDIIGEKELHFYAHSYIQTHDQMNDVLKDDNSYLKKLTLLNNLSWKQTISKWNPQKYTFLKCNEHRLKALYDYTIEKFSADSVFCDKKSLSSFTNPVRNLAHLPDNNFQSM